MRNEDTLSIAVELQNLNVELVANSYRALVFLLQVTCRAEAFYAFVKQDGCALVGDLQNIAGNDGVNTELSLKLLPRILLELLVTKAQTAVLLVDVQNDNLDLSTDLRELVRVFDLLGPAQVADVNQTFYTLFQFNEYAEAGEVAYLGEVTCTNSILRLDGLPWIGFELLDTQTHLAVSTVERQDNALNLLANLQIVVSRTQVLAPAHLTYVNETFNALCNLNECSVVGHYNYFALDVVAYLQVRVQCIPRMRGELLQAESDTLLVLVEIKDNNVDLLVELYDLFRIAYAAPAQVGDVNQTVYAAQVDEYTVVGDVLNCTLEYLTLLKLADNLFLLCLELGLDESLVRNNNIAELRIDLHNLELHRLAYKLVVVTDRTDINLAAR